MTNILDLFDQDDGEDAAQAAVIRKIIDNYRSFAELEGARLYYGAGFNCIPLIHGTKKAAVRYRALHRRRQTCDEFERWVPLFRGGVAIVTGAVSGIVCIDCDGKVGEEVLHEWELAYGLLPVTWTIRSGSGRGVHRYFKHPGHKVTTKSNGSIKLDIKGDGGIAVAPPTLHESGARYTVEIDAPIADLPSGILDFINKKAAGAVGAAKNVSKSLAIKQAQVSNNVSPRPPANKWNIAVIRSMLDAVSDFYVNDYDAWIAVGLALHWFDSGKLGLDLWREFSWRHAEKAKLTDFEYKWSTFDEPLDGRPITIWTLRKMARDCGWNAMAFDWRA